MATYFNRPLHVEFLKSQMYGSANLLKDNLFVMLTSLPVVATLRGRAAFHDKVISRLRFFSASAKLDKWSVMDMSRVLELTRVGLNEIIADPALLLDANYDMYSELVATVPA